MSESQGGTIQDPLGSAANALELVRQVTREGAADAREVAMRTWDATSRFTSRFAFTTCYTFSYGVVFPTVYLARSIPRNNAVVQGFVDGAQDAIHRVDQLRSK
jgi:hypothetical protein